MTPTNLQVWRLGIGRLVAAAMLAAALVVAWAAPAGGHAASYCGHTSVIHTHSGDQYRHVFSQHWGSTPHEHSKTHQFNDLGRWLFLHSVTAPC